MTDVLEPGSTNKAITIATAVQDGLITPDSQFTVPHQIEMGGHVFADDEYHPTQVMSAAQILTQSSNVGTIKIASKLGPEKLDAALRRFGLGQLTTATFPGQSAGLLLPVSQYHDTGMGSVPIGYGLAVTPLQMLDVYATLANGGVTVPPRLIDATIASNGHRENLTPSTGHRVVSATTATTVTRMLEGVVRDGTGVCGAVTGFSVAGKTGTSRKPVAGGYSSSQHMASFVGYTPAEAPRLAAIVVLDSPDDVYGGRAAAPVFSEIMRAGLRAERVTPPTPGSNPPQWVVAAQSAQAQRTNCQVPHGAALATRLAAERAAAAQRAKDRAHPTTTTTTTAGHGKSHGKAATTSTTAKSASHSAASTTSTTAPRAATTTAPKTTTTTGARPPGTGNVTTTTTAPNG